MINLFFTNQYVRMWVKGLRMSQSFVTPWVPRRVISCTMRKDTCRPTVDDVTRISQGRAAKRRGTGSRAVPHRLNEDERTHYNLAIERGFLTLDSNAGYRRERKGSPLFNTWRMWNDARGKPAVMLVKRGQRRPMDEVWIDVSTMRDDLHQLADSVDSLAARLDEKVDASGIIEEDGDVSLEDAVELNGADAELLPTWRIPEVWIKYKFEERSDAKKAARLVAGYVGSCETGGKHEKKKERKSRQFRKNIDVNDLEGDIDLESYM